MGPAGDRLADGLTVVEIPLRFREEEDVLVGAGRAVQNRFRHRVSLRPHAVGTEPPTPPLELERDPPRDSRQVLRFELAVAGGTSPRPTPAAGLGRVPVGENASADDRRTGLSVWKV